MNLVAHVFCCPAARERLEVALEGVDTRLFDVWGCFADAAPTAPVLAVVLDLDMCLPIQDVVELQTACPHPPFILAAPRGTRLADDAGFDRTVPRGLVAERLKGRIRYHQYRVARARTRARVLDGDHTLKSLRDPVARWLDASPPPRTVTKAAATIGCSVKTVERAFLEEVRPAGGTSLKRAMDSIMLYRVCEMLALGKTKATVAHQLRLSERTLSRMARRAWGRRLTDLRDLAPSEAAQLLRLSLGLEH